MNADSSSALVLAALSLAGVLLIAGILGIIVGCHLIDADRDRLEAGKLDQARDILAARRPVQLHGRAHYRFRCVSCRRAVLVPLEDHMASGLWQPFRCDDCAPARVGGQR